MKFNLILVFVLALSGCSSLVKESIAESQLRDDGVYELEISDDSFVALKFDFDKDEPLYYRHFYREEGVMKIDKFDTTYRVRCKKDKCKLSFSNYVKGVGSSSYAFYIDDDGDLVRYSSGKWLKFNFKERE
ncbi:hypothetical protein V9N52_003740 [Vibrio navarrensis]